jgi:hypothetical protein
MDRQSAPSKGDVLSVDNSNLEANSELFRELENFRRRHGGEAKLIPEELAVAQTLALVRGATDVAGPKLSEELRDKFFDDAAKESRIVEFEIMSALKPRTPRF